MAPKSLVLVRLFCLGMLARHSEPRDNHECIQSLRYQGKYPLGIVEILQDGWKWGITEANANKWSESQKCYNDVSCETYRCKDGDGKEKFVLNACAREKITDAKSTKCTLHDELGLYCNNPDNPVCSQCYGTKCNENRINLKVPEVVTKKPPKATPKSLAPTTTEKGKPKTPNTANPKGKFCALSFRYAKDYKPRSNLSALKKLVMSTKMVVNINKNYTQGCQTATASCQTYHCKDENENDQFTYNACAEGANDGENKCNEPELDKFCAAPLKSRCEYCTDGYKCNSAKIDLEIIKKPPSATTNEPETTVNVDFGEGSKTGLLCVLHKICNVEKNLNAKLSRRFVVVHSLKKSEKCKEVSKKLKTVQEQDHVQELGDDLSESIQKVGLVFVDDYILAIDK